MAMAYEPDGYSDSSDEEFGLYSGNAEWDEHKVAPKKYEPSAKEKYQWKCDSFYSEILAGNKDAITELVNELDANLEFRDGWTPLLLAASIGNAEVAELLLQKGADVHIHRDYFTTLMAACKCPESTAPYIESASVAKLLIDHGVDVNARTRKRMTAFMYAASAGNQLIVDMLVPLCDVHALDNQGWHALFWAVNDRRIFVVTALIKAGLNVDQIDVRRQSLLELALNEHVDEIVFALAPDRMNNNVTESYSQQIFTYFKEECSERNRFTNKPNFYRDVSLLLNGTKTEQYLPQFMDNHIDLYTFLTITDKKLQDIGISAPFQRFRILYGIFRFHKYPFKLKSIPLVKPEIEYTTLDVSKAVLTAIRQLLTMEASLQYLISHEIKISENKDVTHYVRTIRKRLEHLKKSCGELEVLSKKWDKFNMPVDMINQKTINKLRNKSKWRFVITIGLFSAASYFYIKKKLLNN